MSNLINKSQNASRLTILTHALVFVFGFGLVFVVGWGGAATLLGNMFSMYKGLIAKIGGLVVILFGLATMDVIKLPGFYYDTRPELGNAPNRGWLSSGLMGVFFAAGWTPCIGATLGAILTLGLAQETSSQAMVLSGFYAMGLGVPFILLGLLLERASGWVRKLTPHLRKIQIANGVFLILIGLLIFSNRMTLIAIWAQRNGWFVDLSLSAAVPTFTIAFAAGLLSFLSPCVLPLVPAYLGYLGGFAVSQSGLENA